MAVEISKCSIFSYVIIKIIKFLKRNKQQGMMYSLKKVQIIFFFLES